ncbi:MAG: LacI family DNA-binding transcriptional regulator [Firmicutes bacterium]|nr:LacI family DNA-binding transcriptional regulator [Bacillota bacterium]
MANIKDVAKQAGVGIATVSRVINNSGYVKAETRLRIEKVIKEINYMPNEIARSMTLQKNNIVAFVLPNSTHLFFGELLYHVEEELFEYGYKVMVCNSSEQLEKELVYLDMLKNNRVDALILLTNNDIEQYIDKNLRVISFDRRFEGVPFVASDNYAGGVMAAKRLLELGCKNFMFIGDDAQGDSTPVITEVTKRRTGFKEYLKSVGVENVINIEYPLGNYIVSTEEVHEMLHDNLEVDGIFAISDAVACAVIKELEKNGRRVPEDVKVIGFDGGRSFINLGKRITSIGQNPQLIAKAISESISSFYNKSRVEDKIIPIYFSEGETA